MTRSLYLESEAKYHTESLGQIKKKERAILDIRNELLEADSIMEKYDFQKGALIQVLLDVQEKLHWIPRHIIHWIAVRLNVAPAEIHTIVNFYEAFSLSREAATVCKSAPVPRAMCAERKRCCCEFRRCWASRQDRPIAGSSSRWRPCIASVAARWRRWCRLTRIITTNRRRTGWQGS